MPRDAEREVAIGEDFDILPDQTGDDTDAGWGRPVPRRRSAARRAVLSEHDRRLLEERPPHWE